MKVPFKYRGAAWLVLLLLVLPWGIVRFALGPTLGAWLDCRNLRGRLAGAEDPQAARLERHSDEKPLLLDGALLMLVRDAAAERRVTVGDYKPLVTVAGDGVAVHTAALMLCGSYGDILHVVRFIEGRLPACRLSSLRFAVVVPPDRSPRRLEATLYVEQIIYTGKI